MMRISRKLLTILVATVTVSSMQAMVFDNRYLPLYPRPRLGLEGTYSTFSFDTMAATASGSFSDKQSDRAIGLPELFGKFDLVKLNEALEINGCDDDTIKLRAEWRGGELPWRVDGRIQMQGIAFECHHSLTDWLSVGASWLFMRVNACHSYIRGETNLILSTGDIEDIETRRRNILEALGFNAGHWKDAGFGDVDAYVRLGGRCDYQYKFRRIDYGVRLGMLAPAGVSRNENHLPSVPFGGDGFWGLYAAGDVLLELREDLKVGALFRLNKRFSRTVCRRLGLHEEPQIFGAARVKATVNPGETIVFSPYFLLENLRKGFGVGVQYTLVSHRKDSWRCVELLHQCFKDVVTNDMITKNVCRAEETSKWGADYITLNIFYDFGKVRTFRDFDPVLSFRWDVPAKMLVLHRVAKTHRLSFGLEFSF